MALPATFKVADAVDEAFERCQFDPEGITAKHIASAHRSIRLLLDSWNNDSVDFWKVATGIQQPCTIDMQSFVPAVDGVIDILRMAVLRDVYTTPMIVMAQSDWFAIPDKQTVIGMPNRFWAERAINTVTSFIYPKSENNTDILIYDAMVRSNNSTILGAQADVPSLWNEAFVSGLAFFLGKKFARALLPQLQADYGGPLWQGPPGAYQVAKMGNRERADTIFVVHKARRPRR